MSYKEDLILEMYGTPNKMPNDKLIRELAVVDTAQEIENVLKGFKLNSDEETIRYILEYKEKEKTEKEIVLYTLKNEILKNEYYFEEVQAKEFYRDLFPCGSFQRKGHLEDNKPNAIATILKDEKNKNCYNKIITDDLETIEEVTDGNFVIISPVSYIGRRKTGNNARYSYAITIDLDDVEEEQLRNLIHQIDEDILPRPTYLINSGRGFHLYYFLEEPIALYKNIQMSLINLKKALIKKIWNYYTSKRDKQEFQGIIQGYRIVGGQSKLGEEYKVRAFKTGEKVSIEYLNSFVEEEDRVKDFTYKSELTLADAKIKYSDWYERRIINNEEVGQWNIKRDLYDWWLNKIKMEAVCGHRYWTIYCLAVYARKCNINYKELEKDAYSLLDIFDKLSVSEQNRFTRDDIKAALKAYKDSKSSKLTKAEITNKTTITMPTNKRNGQKQNEHLEEARAVRDIRMKRQGRKWDENNGRKPKGELVKNFKESHPNGTKAACIKETGLAKSTVYKWWNIV